MSSEKILMQMLPGEGKSIVIAVAAILLAKKLTNKTIDIVTCNKFLAYQGYLDHKGLFEKNGISVGCTYDENLNTVENKMEVYEKQVVYSTSFTA